MQTLQHILVSLASSAIHDAFGEHAASFLPAEIVQATQLHFGHYQCNSPLKLAKVLAKPPRVIAETLAEAIRKRAGELLIKIEVAGPGFINLTVAPSVIGNDLLQMISSPTLGISPINPQKIIVEYSSPNVAKELHVGHLRSTIIGECLARILAFRGHNILRLNHVGDWGTQFGMLIAYLKRNHPAVLSGTSSCTLQELMYWYREAKKCFDEDAQFKLQAQKEVVFLQGGEPEALRAWEMICEISRKAYREIYDLLDVHLEERGESFYNQRLAPLVDDLSSRGIATVSDGAVCIFLDGFFTKEGQPLPMIIRKSDGGFNYDTTDLAALYQRLFEEKADRIIYVVDAGQSLHFEMLFAAAKRIGWLDLHPAKIEHVAFGVVLGSDGKKFKTRSGETERLIDLLQTAVDEAYLLLKERNSDLSEEKLQEMAKILGIGAVKYADLSSNRIKDYQFSYERMLRFEGNTAAFLLYSYVRVQGIKRKVGKNIEALSKATIILEHESEIALGLHLRQFAEVLESIEGDLLPHHLTEYLYHLAEKFNAFFRDCRVEGSEFEDSRLLLCELTAKVLEKGLSLLGIKTLDRM